MEGGSVNQPPGTFGRTEKVLVLLRLSERLGDSSPAVYIDSGGTGAEGLPEFAPL